MDQRNCDSHSEKIVSACIISYLGDSAGLSTPPFCFKQFDYFVVGGWAFQWVPPQTPMKEGLPKSRSLRVHPASIQSRMKDSGLEMKTTAKVFRAPWVVPFLDGTLHRH